MGLFSRFFGPPDQQKFAQQILKALRAAGDTNEYRFDAQEFRLIIPAPNNGYANLHNHYAEHCKLSRPDRKRHLKQIVRSINAMKMEMPDEFEHARHDIRPAIRTRATMTFINLERDNTGNPLPEMPLVPMGEHLYSTVVYDTPSSMQSISLDDLKDWGVSLYEALEAGICNLREDNAVMAAVGDSLYVFTTGDNYDSARLLLVDRIQEHEVKGDYIAMIPNRDTLMFTGSEDVDGLEMMLTFAEQQLEEPRPFLFTPLKLEDQEWVDWKPEHDHPLFKRFKNLATRDEYLRYDHQKELYQKIHEQNGTTPMEATCFGGEDDSGQLFTYCVWQNRPGHLLPKTDEIMFGDQETGEAIASFPWELAMTIVKDCLEPVDIYPLRYRVIKFPDSDHVKALSDEAF